MKPFRAMLIAHLAVAVLAAGAATAATNTNYSDQWWVPAESGWGVSVHQQNDVLFVELLAYGAGGRPTWYTAAAVADPTGAQGHDVFAGALYSTTGPPYAVDPFDPARVAARKVGTLVFDATATNAATMTFTIDGVATTKALQRQTWARISLQGTYEGFWWNYCNAGVAPDWEPTTLVIEHFGNAVSMVLTCPECWGGFRHELRGSYTQHGHVGEVTADLIAPDVGTITLYDIEMTSSGFTARLRGTIGPEGAACRMSDGRVAAARVR